MDKPVNGKIDRLVWEAVRSGRPLTLCLTNFVTVTDCANAVLAVGGAPVMSLDSDDALELAGSAAAVVLNIGTVTASQLSAMLGTGQAARTAGKPVVLDPVGAGATRVRMDACMRILDEVGPSIIRGNASEILALDARRARKGPSRQKGVDAAGSEKIPQVEEAAASLSARHSCVVAVSGETDIIVQGQMRTDLSGGSELLTRVTGTGCMLSAIVGCCAGAVPEKLFGAAMAAMSAMKEAGARAEAKLAAPGSLGEFRSRLCDELSEIAVS
ncbi:MAG: hydroxyethylthiazole kinase [Deltaproteobacteria bacterium]|jgi:hydroxyethylthiazole kinase|nr:hydroxyethylthiazole kinase [Deltaproteobacteria bacterium]